MKISVVNLLLIIVMCVLFSTSVTALPSNRWQPSDPRCSGFVSGHIRLKRSAGDNGGSGQSYKFNPNTGSCEKIYGSNKDDYNTFDSQKLCDQLCLNIYHFG